MGGFDALPRWYRSERTRITSAAYRIQHDTFRDHVCPARGVLATSHTDAGIPSDRS